MSGEGEGIAFLGPLPITAIQSTKLGAAFVQPQQSKRVYVKRGFLLTSSAKLLITLTSMRPENGFIEGAVVFAFAGAKRYSCGVTVTVQIPDDLMGRLRVQSGDLSRRLMEALAIDEYRQGRLSKVDLRQVLGFETRPALDAFLKEHGVVEEYTLEDLEHDRQDLLRSGF